MSKVAPAGIIVAALLVGGCSSAVNSDSGRPDQVTSQGVQDAAPSSTPTSRPVSDWRFYNPDGSFQTALEVKRAAAASPDLRSNVKALDVIFNHVEAAINYVADQKTTMEATGKTPDQVTLDDYRMVTKEYQALVLGTVIRGQGQLSDLLYTAAGDTTNARFSNDEYRITLTQDFVGSQTLTVADNAGQIGATGSAARTLGAYRVLSRSGDDVTVLERPPSADPETYVSSYSVDGAIGLAKMTK